MDRLQSMQVFVRVAQHSSFAAAARELRISPAAASKQVNALEAHVGARLLDRTTRRVGLTEAGRIYLERCLECLHALEDADASMSELAKAPSGVLRITAPVDFGAPLLPVLNTLMAANESLGIDLRLSNRVMDMVEEGVDVAVRVARSLDARYVARPVARTTSAGGRPCTIDEDAPCPSAAAVRLTASGAPRSPRDEGLGEHRQECAVVALARAACHGA